MLGSTEKFKLLTFGIMFSGSKKISTIFHIFSDLLYHLQDGIHCQIAWHLFDSNTLLEVTFR